MFSQKVRLQVRQVLYTETKWLNGNQGVRLNNKGFLPTNLLTRGGQWVVLTLLLASINGCMIFDKSEDKKRAQLHLKIGTSYFSKGDHPNALNQLMTAAQLDPQNPVIQHNLGLAYFVRKKYTKAEYHIRQAVQIEKKYTEARSNLGRVLIELSLYKEAIDELKIAQEDLTFPYPEKPLIHSGIAYFKLGLFQQALELLKKSLEIQPKNCASNSFMGRSYFELKEYPRAIQSLNQAIDFCKGFDFDEPHYYSALSYYQMRKKAKAITTLENLISQFPKGEYIDRAHKLLEIIR